MPIRSWVSSSLLVVVSSVVCAALSLVAAAAPQTVAGWGYTGFSNIDNLSSLTQVAAGYSHTVALKANGSVACWGDNLYGKCTVPANLGPVAQVAAGRYHTVALKANGSVACWGDNQYGQCTVPANLGPVAQVAAGGYHTVALKADGSVACWGSNGNGQCNVPANLGPVAQVDAGGSHTVALKADGSVACWGYNLYGQCTVPANLGPVVQVAAGGSHTVALLSNCGPGEIRDCNGNCAPASWLGDDICDDGAYVYLGNAISFDCPSFNSDNGDCAPPADPFITPPNQGAPETTPYDAGALNEINQSNTTNLVVVVHGWNTTIDNFILNWLPFEQELDDRTTVPGQWTFIAYPWTEKCGRWSYNPLFSLHLNALFAKFSADKAATNGWSQGLMLGKTIGAVGYSHIHLIGHSAGSALITSATKAIRAEVTALGRPQPVIHCTFLDAYAPAGILYEGMTGTQLYGTNADFSDQYFAKSQLYDITGSATARTLEQVHNIDVTNATSYDCPVLSTPWCAHRWPVDFYRKTTRGDLNCTDEGSIPMGFDLAKETLGSAWQGTVSGLSVGSLGVLTNDPDCPAGDGGVAGDAGSEDDGLVPFVRLDAVLNLASLKALVSSPADVTITAKGVSLTTAPSSDSAWVNLQFTTALPTNFVQLNLDFMRQGENVGLLTAYFDGQEIGFADEGPYILDGADVTFYFGLQAEPGIHVLSFRLDDQAAGSSTIQVNSVATGWSGYVLAADLNGDGVVNGADLVYLLSAWGPCTGCPADLNHDGDVNGADMSAFLSAWTAS